MNSFHPSDREPVAPIVHGTIRTANEALELAERELERLQRRSIASLLRQAAALVAPRARGAGIHGAFPLPRGAERPWRRAARAELRSLVATGPGTPSLPLGATVLARLLDRRLERWPSVSRIAQAARRVEDSEFARICLGTAWLLDGQLRSADAMFRSLLRRPEVLRHRWRVLQGLALTHLAAGRDELALGAIESCAEDPECGITAVVEALGLTLVIGDPARARRAAARLDMLVDPYAPAFVAALARIRARVQRFDGGRTLRFLARHPKTAIVRNELARELRSPAGCVARAMM